jgi:hypothetical protein
MSVALFIVGEPGAGKTTLARSLLGTPPYSQVVKPKWTISGNVIAAGHYTGAMFDGADTVGYNQVNETLMYWEASLISRLPLTIFDGDRFSHTKAFERVKKCAIPVCVHLLGGETVAERRRARSEQNETWVKGRITKAVNFTKLFANDSLIVINAALSAAEVAEQTRRFLQTFGVEGIK